MPNPSADRALEELCRRVADLRGDVRQLVDDEVRHVAPLATPAERRQLADSAVARLAGLGALDALLADPTVDEVLVNGGRDVWVERHGALERAGTVEGPPVEHLVERILAPIGRRVDRTSPIVDARLPDGSRVCAVVAPVAVEGTSLSIRRFAQDVRELTEFTDGSGHDLCAQLIAARCNVLVSGATSSGKTSLLAALLGTVPRAERILVLEDTAELPIAGGHTVRLEARPPTADQPLAITVADLVRAALRLRPERLVVGEVRGDEVLGLMQAMNTGHDGSLATCHANGPADALVRIATLVLQAAPHWPLGAIHHQLSRSIDVVVHVARLPTGRRAIVEVAEVLPTDDLAADRPPQVRRLATRDAEGRLQRVAELTRGRA